MAPSTYDTAWVASIPDTTDPSRPRYPRSLRWLVSQQHDDGSFGASTEHWHDRIMCTLAALRAMVRFPTYVPAVAISAAQGYLWRIAHRHPTAEIETSGFELLVPALGADIASHGISLPAHLDHYAAQRAQKLALIPDRLWYTPGTSLSFSIEFLGPSADPGRLRSLQGSDGSICSSPAATAFLLHCGPNPAASAYLEACMDRQGAVPPFAPYTWFESLWIGYHRAISAMPASTWLAPTLRAALRAALARGQGIGFDVDHALVDGDDTAVAILLLRWLGEDIGPESLQPFTRETGYVTYQMERHPSTSANAHILHALCTYPQSAERDERIAVALDFLAGQQQAHAFWLCKWHASALYATCRVLRALAALPPAWQARGADLAMPTLVWLRETQHLDGGWGFFDAPTAEETAYGILGLSPWRELAPWLSQTIDRAGAALADLRAKPPAPLWSGKTLYLPRTIVESVLDAAQRLAGPADAATDEVVVQDALVA
jgi:hypothetical protein